MSQDWMKFEKATLEKPEVFRMSASLQIERDLVVGKLLRAWAYFDTQTTDGILANSSQAFLDGIVGLPGFSAAMISVRWLIEKRGSLCLPNFDRHNGETAKQRAMTSLRVQRYRKSKSDKGCNADVTDDALQPNDKKPKSVTPRVEESRGEKNNTPLPPKGGKGNRRRVHETPKEIQERYEAEHPKENQP